jgi:hypothetical protein
MLAYTGARHSDIAGLLATDIGQDADIHFLHIRENRLRGLKNRSSQRRIPLHPHLIELGFLEFVAEKRTSDGNTLLVPEIDRLDILGHRPRDVNEATYRRDERPLGPLNVAISLLPRLF